MATVSPSPATPTPVRAMAYVGSDVMVLQAEPRFTFTRNTRAARNAAASDASDAAVKIAFLCAFTTFSQWSRYCA